DNFLLFFFFQAEDGIRDRNVTGVQTCALPILKGSFSNDQIIIGLVALVSSLLILYSIMKIFIYGFWGDKQEDLPKKSTKGLLSPIIFLVSISVFLGVGA